MTALPTLQAAITGILEAALNQALALDPAGRDTLMSALSRPVCFHITAPAPFTLCLQATASGVQVTGEYPEAPTLEVSGPPLAFAALALGDDAVFADGRLEVIGDTARALQLQHALHHLEPDWEAALARHTGDLPAHFLGQRVRGAARWIRQATASVNASIEEYIHEESRMLPGRRELEATYEDIDDLSLRVERLAARVSLLEASDGPATDAGDPETEPS